jgi:hypothetical protein
VLRIDGAVSLIEGACTHAGGPVAMGRIENDVVTCLLHGSSYRLRDDWVGSAAAAAERRTATLVQHARSVAASAVLLHTRAWRRPAARIAPTPSRTESMQPRLEIAQEAELQPIEAIAQRSGGIEDDPRVDRQHGPSAIETGMANARRHLANVKQFGIPCVVAVNRRPGDTNEEVELVRRLAMEAGAFAAEANEGFTKGGIGAADLASAVVDACEQTHLSLSSDPNLLNAPEGFTLPVRDIRAYTGAGWLVPLCSDMMQMPGLCKPPAALNVDIDADERTAGRF